MHVVYYQAAKNGDWDGIMRAMSTNNHANAGTIARVTNRSSGYGMLHQAAYYNNRVAARELIKHGAIIDLRAKDGKSPIDVARERGFVALGDYLLEALRHAWRVSPNPMTQASSNCYKKPIEKVNDGAQSFFVGYQGGIIEIVPGARYYEDEWGRVLVGWHGTTNPPRGMDGQSMFDH